MSKANFTFKVVIIGAVDIGKKTFARGYSHDLFDLNYDMTIGMDPTSYHVSYSGVNAVLSLWRINPRDRFKLLRSMFYRGTHAVCLFFDLTRRDSLTEILPFWDEILDQSPKSLFFLIGNKCDLVDERQISEQEMEEKARQIGAYDYMEVSALTGENIELLFDRVGEALLAPRVGKR